MQERYKLTKKEQYDYLIKARNFHYDNYAKWASYFYLITVAIFIALYNSKNTNKKGLFSILNFNYY